MARVALVLFSLLALYIQQGLSLNCFVCSSDVDASCGDPFNATRARRALENCDRGKGYSSYSMATNTYCRKYTHFVAGQLITVRSCVWTAENDDGPCSTRSISPVTRPESCSYCDQHECNSASSLISTLIFFPFSLLASRFL